jgi:hypothetical protein
VSCYQRLDWDEGFLRFHLEMRRMNRYGDTMVCTGTVVRKYVEKGELLVECQVWAFNHREGVTTPCRAWITLPSRAA